MDIGVESIGVQLPRYALDVRDLAVLHGASPEKFTTGLGCRIMGLCLDDQSVVDLAVGAARRALAFWGGDPKSIGLLAVGTETSLDEARPLSAWVAESLDLYGNIRSYEVKHACYGGMLAVRQALEWHLSGAALPGQVALVIASDICLYPFLHPAEPTQGAGAVALIIGRPLLSTFARRSFCYSEPIYDFYRPFGQSFPIIQGKQSVEAYCRALHRCVAAFCAAHSTEDFLRLDRFSCHIPFPRMVQKAITFLSQKMAFSDDDTKALLKKVACDFEWSRVLGNTYTASLWFSFAKNVAELKPGETLGLFSYGSGCGAELMQATVTRAGDDTPWVDDILKDLKARDVLTIERYQAFREKIG